MAHSTNDSKRNQNPANIIERKMAPSEPDEVQPQITPEKSLLTSDRASEIDLLKLQLAINMDTYKHHYELFVKTIIIFLAVLGAIGGYIFQTGTNEMTKGILSLFVSISSITGFFAGFSSRSWVTSVERNVDEAAAKLGIAMPPLSISKRMILIGQILALLLFLASLTNAILAMRR